MWRQTFPPVTAAPLNVDMKDPLPSKCFPHVGARHVRCRLSPTTRVCCVFRRDAYVCKRETPLAVITSFFIYLFLFRSCDVRLHRPNEFMAPTLIYNAVSFLPGSADEIFSFIWLESLEILLLFFFSFLFFCLEGNAVILIKPGSKPELNFSLWRAEQSDGTIKVSADNYGISGISWCMSPVKKHIDIHTVTGSGPRWTTVN